MARNSQLSARLVQSLVEQAHRKLGTGGLILLAVLGIGYLVAEPVLEARLGIDLPGIHQPEEVASTPRQPDSRPTTTESGSSNSADIETSSAKLEDVLEQTGTDTYRSPAGLVYTRGSVHGHRLKHLESHTVDDPGRDGSHGVFKETDMAKLIPIVDEVYLTGLKGGRGIDHRRESDRDVYTVDMKRPIGTVGGKSGARGGHPTARHVRLVVEGKRFITAFPLRP